MYVVWNICRNCVASIICHKNLNIYRKWFLERNLFRSISVVLIYLSFPFWKKQNWSSGSAEKVKHKNLKDKYTYIFIKVHHYKLVANIVKAY